MGPALSTVLEVTGGECSTLFSCFMVGPKVDLVHKHMYIICMYIYIHTSSTAQGGGGSFKDRKPIGEVRCCESWMAEQIH